MATKRHKKSQKDEIHFKVTRWPIIFL